MELDNKELKDMLLAVKQRETALYNMADNCMARVGRENPYNVTLVENVRHYRAAAARFHALGDKLASELDRREKAA